MSDDPPRDSFTFLHAADVHLDSPLRGLERYEGAPADAIRGASRRAFENLVELAIEDAVDFVLIAGDLYDGDWKDYNTGLFFIAQMTRLGSAGIPVYVIAGNHDAESQITRRLRLPQHVHLFATDAPQTCTPSGLNVAIHGQGFARREITEDLTRAYPAALAGRFNIGLLHTALSGRDGHAPYAPCSVEGLRALGYDYWALGHVHAREIVSEQPWIVFPGNLQGRHARETGAKGATRVRVEDGAVTGVQHVPLDTVRWSHCSVDVAEARDLEQVLARVETALADAVREAAGRLAAVRVTLTGACAAHAQLRAEPARVTAECRALADMHADALWVEQVRVRTQPLHSLAAALTRDDAIGGLLRAIDALDATQARPEAAALFDDLRTRLQAVGADFDPLAPDALHEALEDVKALLVERLLGGNAA
jgi:DNA repair exonuclease SbcCD nuclease subunit